MLERRQHRGIMPFLNGVNDSSLRLSVFEGKYRRHVHPTSNELFVVLGGAIVIELKDGSSIRIGPLQAATVPAGTVHRTTGNVVALPGAIWIVSATQP